jgi:hypothetical protein
MNVMTHLGLLYTDQVHRRGLTGKIAALVYKGTLRLYSREFYSPGHRIRAGGLMQYLWILVILTGSLCSVSVPLDAQIVPIVRCANSDRLRFRLVLKIQGGSMQ